MTHYSGTDNLEAMAEANHYNRFLVERILAHAPERGELLDFGAGIGTFARQVSARGHRVACLEPDLALASRLRAAGLQTFVSLDEVADESLDYVFTLDVLEHIEDDAGALRGIARKMKANGRLLVYVPAFPILYSSMDRKVGHFRRYRRGQLAQRVADAGFTGVHARYVDSIGFFASLAYRLSDNGSGDINLRMLKLYDRLLFPASRLLNPLFGRWFGKNIMLTATRSPGLSDRPSASAAGS